jgi:deoxyribodipyrimidine photo-lyase
LLTCNTITVIWLKRDLRLHDHACFAKAQQLGLPIIIIYVWDATELAYPDASLRHHQFVYHSLLAMQLQLKPYNIMPHQVYCSAVQILQSIALEYNIAYLLSYQESGTQLTFDRDKLVQAYCDVHNIHWIQYAQNAVQRGISNRSNWDKQWYATMHSPQENCEFNKLKSVAFTHSYSIPMHLVLQWQSYPSNMQPAGEHNAWKYLNSFVQLRAKGYSKYISKPMASRTSCSRLSVYLAWGNLSIKQVYQYTLLQAQALNNKRYYTNFLSRLKWHSHFVQKFETDCTYEHTCINKGYELLKYPYNEDYIKAWCTGNTGYPLVDANMRCVQATGWINFRMRALVVSFLTHNLLQDWRHGAYYLAQQFLDYIPGIHYTQFQMQAGTTGINTIRIYNPVKNSMEHDPEALFIKKWCPELAHLPLAFIHEPYLMTEAEQILYQCELGIHYAKPIVALEASRKQAADFIWGHRKNSVVQQENQRILNTHTRRKTIKEDTHKIIDNHAQDDKEK